MMRRSAMRFLLTLTVVLGVAVWLGPGAVRADHAWGPYHWARSVNPVTLAIGDNVSAVWDLHLIEAVADWDHGAANTAYPDVINLNLGAGATSPRNCKAVAGRIEVCSSAYGYNGWLGLARIWANGDGHITQATTQVNDSYFGLPEYNNDATRLFVVCQEVGHAFGLDHQDEDFDDPNMGSCMDYTSDPGGTLEDQLSNEHPNDHDFEQLAAIYAHLDAPSGGGGSGPPGRGRGGAGAPAILPDVPGLTPGSSPGEWGALVRANRRTALFELDLGNGHKLFTFVIWA